MMSRPPGPGLRPFPAGRSPTGHRASRGDRTPVPARGIEYRVSTSIAGGSVTTGSSRNRACRRRWPASGPRARAAYGCEARRCPARAASSAPSAGPCIGTSPRRNGPCPCPPCSSPFTVTRRPGRPGRSLGRVRSGRRTTCTGECSYFASGRGCQVPSSGMPAASAIRSREVSRRARGAGRSSPTRTPSRLSTRPATRTVFDQAGVADTDRDGDGDGDGSRSCRGSRGDFAHGCGGRRGRSESAAAGSG
jgi:hypothetical protein